MSSQCLKEEDLIEIFYTESQPECAKLHLSECSACQEAFARICNELIDIDMHVPDGGQRAVNEALALIKDNKKSNVSEILTIEELAQWLKVSNHNIHNMLPRLPHSIIDGHIRFDRSQITRYLFNGTSGAEMKAPDQPRQRLISLPSLKTG